MKKVLLLSLLALTACTTGNNNCEETVRKAETAAIAAVVFQYCDNNNVHGNLPFSQELRHLRVITDANPDEEVAADVDMIAVHPYNDIHIKKLLLDTVNGKLFFSPHDSIHFVNQDCRYKFTLPENILAKHQTIVVDRHPKNKSAEYIGMSFPLFAADNKKAFVTIDVFSKETRFRNAIYLEKIGPLWKIIGIQGVGDN